MKKVLAIAGLVLAFSMVSVASAATVAELQAMIAQLQAQIAALSGTATVSSSAPTITKNLTVGSRGDEVSALQQFLIDGGYLVIDAPTGYFGAMTKTAVVAWQKEVGLPSTGYFGPMSRAKLAEAVVTTPITTTPGTTDPIVGLDQTDGSVTVGNSAYVSTSQTLKKGDVKDVLAVQLKAINGKVSVNRFDVEFNTYPWLIFNQAVLKDSKGTVLATKSISSAADVTEITSGSKYLLRFDGLNYVVDPSENADLVINLSVLPASDKITGQIVTVTIPNGGIRTINGKGFSDTPSAGQSATLTMSSTGNVGDLSATVSASSPVAGAVAIPSTAGTTKNDVPLGVFSLKLQNNGGKVNALSVNIKNSLGYDATTLFQNVRLVDVSSGKSYSASSFTSAGAAVFDMTSGGGIALTQDSWKDLRVLVDVLATSSAAGYKASSSLDISTISAVDNNYNTVTYGSATMSGVSDASNPAASDQTMVTNAMVVTNISTTKNVTSNQNGVWVAAYPVLTFTLTNNSNNPLFISKTPSTALGTSTSAGPVASSTVTSVTVTPGTDSISGDTDTDYIIPVGQSASRTFAYAYTMDNTNGTTAGKKLSVTQINYGPAGSVTANAITTGLSNLFVQVP